MTGLVHVIRDSVTEGRLERRSNEEKRARDFARSPCHAIATGAPHPKTAYGLEFMLSRIGS